MMNRETFVKLEDLHKQGWTIKEIAAELGYHPATISKWLKCGPPVRRAASDEAKVMTARWAERVEALVGAYPRLLGVSVWRCLRAEGFEGCYSTVTGELRRIRGPRFHSGGSGVGADSHRSGRGGPVRLLQPRRSRPPLGLERLAALLRDDLVLEPLAGVVVLWQRNRLCSVSESDAAIASS